MLLCLPVLAACADTGSSQVQNPDAEGPLPALTRAVDRQDISRLPEPLRRLTVNHSLVSQPEEALKVLGQALDLARAAHDRAAESLVLNATARIEFDIGHNDEALRGLQAALPVAQALPERSEEAAVRVTLAEIYGFTGHPEQALVALAPTLTLSEEPALRADALTRRAEVFNATGKLKDALADTVEVLTLEHANNLNSLTIDTLIVQGEIDNSLGESAKALAPLTEALELARSLDDRRDEGRAINFLGESAFGSGDTKRALDLWTQALPIERAVGDRPDEATTLHDIGAYHWATGDPRQAIDFYNQSVVIQREVLDSPDQAVTFNDLANAYAGLGEPEKAIASFDQALPIERAVGNVAFEATTLRSMANVYRNIAQPAKALELYQQSLVLERKVGDGRAATAILTGLGAVYRDMGRPQQALRFYQQALAAQRKAKYLRMEGVTLGDIGAVYFHSGRQKLAHVYLDRALAMELQDGDRRDEAFTRWKLASLGAQSVEGYLEALHLAQTSGDPDLSGSIQTSLMLYYRDHGSIATAIYFGKSAVNNFQQVRGNLKDLGQASQDTFVDSRGDTYRDLARLLFQSGRFPEAEQVIDLLKKQEYAEFVRGDGGAGSTAPLPMTNPESMVSSITSDEMNWLTLKALKNARTPEQQAQYLSLDAKLSASNRAFSQQIQEVLTTDTNHKNVLAETSGLQNILRQLGSRSPDTVGVYTLVSEKELDLIVVTGNLRLAPRRIAISREDLTAKVKEMRDRLQDPCSDPRPAAQAMYKVLIAPILTDLRGAHTQTIVWELDGALRYIPMSALYDGSHYLAESYRSVLFGASNQASLVAESIGTHWSGLGFGTSQKRGDFAALPAVTQELDGIFQDKSNPASNGPIPGHIHLDQDFTERTMADELDVGYPIVHIASHFVLEPGSDESYLLLGAEEPGHPGSGRLTYAELRDGPSFHFDGVELLTLSACQTGTSIAAHSRDGAEVDALDDLAAARGAKAVMATLWSVNDASTGRFMVDFYKDWTSADGTPKSEALRKAQVDMLHGGADLPGSSCHASQRHPFFWAPFILIGNWQ
jgi:CHAT domain-containing protein/tetratricopeptide (TPR) repeat protein